MRRVIIVAALALAVFLIAANPAGATHVFDSVTGSLRDIGSGFGDFIKSIG